MALLHGQAGLLSEVGGLLPLRITGLGTVRSGVAGRWLNRLTKLVTPGGLDRRGLIGGQRLGPRDSPE